MPAALDVATRMLNVAGGRLLPDEPPGFSLMPAPRKAARGRERDALILCLGLRGREAVAPERYDALLDLAANTFFGSPGSVTSALRQAVIAVNQKMLDDNLAAGGAPKHGGLIAAALRDADFYVVQGGPGLLLVARPAAHERFPNAPTRPLGQSNTVDALYFHTQLAVGDFLCFSNAPARGWTDIALVGLGNLADLGAVAERLRETAGSDAVALIGRVVDEQAAAQLIAAANAAASAAANATANTAAAGPARQAAGSPATAPRPAPTPVIPAASPAATPTRAALHKPEIAAAPPETQEPAEPGPRSANRQTSRGAGLAEFFRLKPRTARPTSTPADSPTTSAPDAGGTDFEAGEIPVTIEAGAAEPEVFWGSPHESAVVASSAPAQPREPEPTVEEARTRPMAPAPRPAPPAAEPQPPAAPVRAGLMPGVGGQLRRGLRSMGRAIGVTLAEAIRGVRVTLARVLPEGMLQREGLFTVPTSVQVSIAVIIPVLVVGTSVWLYLENGRNQQYSGTLGQAELEVARGRTAADAASARPHWESALQWLAEAEALRPGQPEVAALKHEAQGKLDELDWITRLDFKPLLSGSLGLDAKVTRLLLSGQDVYGLDTAHNRVVRAMLNPSAGTATSGQAAGYAIDSSFQCSGKQTVRDVNVGELVDAAIVPGPTVIGGDTTVNSDVVIALDNLGALLYCAPGLSQAYASNLAAPNVGWVHPTALQLYADRLYVLDPGTNEIWQYQSSGGAFAQAPTRYFSSASYDLADAIGFTIAGGDVFVLRKDGRVTNCTRTAPGAGPTCTPVTQFTDPRPGRGVGDKLAGLTVPAQLIYDQPPEPSLYLLDGQSSGMYQLSLKLALVRQFRPYFPFSAPISAMVIDPAKRFFVSAGDNIYLAARP